MVFLGIIKVVPMFTFKNRILRKSVDNVQKLVNGFVDDRRIYIDKSEHPFWKSYQDCAPVQYTLQPLARLCHFFNVVPKHNTKPFIIDFEHVLMMSGRSRDYSFMVASVERIRDQLLDDKCKSIFVPSNGAIREVLKYIAEPELVHKFKVVRPSYPIQLDKQFENGPFKILTIGNKFWGKGIPIAIEVFRKLRKKHGDAIEMQLVCGDVPKGYPLPKGLKLLDIPLMSDSVRKKLYSEAHVFIFPCLHDSFAVYQESMAYGVPMIATRIYDKDELVLDGVTGYLVDTPLSLYDGNFGVDWDSWGSFQNIAQRMVEQGEFSDMIDKMISKTELLMHDRDLLMRMGMASQKIQREKFSAELKNIKVLDAYDQILNLI